MVILKRLNPGRIHCDNGIFHFTLRLKPYAQKIRMVAVALKFGVSGRARGVDWTVRPYGVEFRDFYESYRLARSSRNFAYGGCAGGNSGPDCRLGPVDYSTLFCICQEEK